MKWIVFIVCMFNYRHAERSDAAANVVIAVGWQRADGAAGAWRRCGRSHARRRPAPRRHGSAALRAPSRLQAAALPAAAALRLPAEEPPPLPVRVPPAAATASAAALPSSQGTATTLLAY